MNVQRGVGYSPSEVNKKDSEDLNAIYIDSSFSPILRVNHSVENIRVGKELDYDSLTLDVWTDGSVNSEDAIKEAAEILVENFNLFGQINQQPEEEEKVEVEESGQSESAMGLSIDDLELSARSSNCLKRAGIETLAELIEKDISELIQIKNFGKKSADEINDKLKQFNLSLKGTM